MFLHKVDDEISLKLVEVKDAERIFQLTEESREHLREWLPWLDYNTKLEDTQEFLQASVRNYAEGKSMNTVILYKGKIVGVAGFNEIDSSNKIGYIGYWLGHNYQGKGIVTRVAKELTNYAFIDLKLNRIEITVATENKKSRYIPERLGYRNEGCKREAEWLYDHYVDHIVYGITASEWGK